MQNRLARIAATAPFNCSILLLSEDPDGAQRADLAQPGFQVLRARNTREAKRIFAERAEISVVIIDLETTGADGTHLAGALRTEHAGRDWVEYVILSGSGTPDIGPSFDALACDRLSKPLGPGQLLAAVTQSYNSARLRRLNQEEGHFLEASMAEFQTRIGTAASQLLAHIKQGYGATTAAAPPAGDERDAARQLRTLVHEEKMRARLREKVFGSLAHNRARWMLLLVLSEAFQARQEVTIKSTAYQAGLPLSSALRLLNEMCSQGLAARRGDPLDARRSFVALTPLGQSYFMRYAAELSRAKAADTAS